MGKGAGWKRFEDESSDEIAARSQKRRARSNGLDSVTKIFRTAGHQLWRVPLHLPNDSVRDPSILHLRQKASLFCWLVCVQCVRWFWRSASKSGYLLYRAARIPCRWRQPGFMFKIFSKLLKK